MKLTYQKDGVALKYKLKKLQRTNSYLWLLTQTCFVFFLISLGVFLFIDNQTQAENTPRFTLSLEEARVQSHHMDALLLLENHRAPSIGIEIADRFIIHKELLKGISYEENSQQVSLDFTFQEMTPAQETLELMTLTQSKLFTKISSRPGELEGDTFISGTIPYELFLYKNTLPIIDTP